MMLLQRAGYSLQELFLLSRSQLIQQRSLALGTLANILSKVHACNLTHTCTKTHANSQLGDCVLSPRQARAGTYLSVVKGSVIATLLDAGLLFLLRFALDDNVEGVMSAAVHALKALLVCAEDEVSSLWILHLGLITLIKKKMALRFIHLVSSSRKHNKFRQ